MFNLILHAVYLLLFFFCLLSPKLNIFLLRHLDDLFFYDSVRMIDLVHCVIEGVDCAAFNLLLILLRTDTFVDNP